jgi:hypothetical protein
VKAYFKTKEDVIQFLDEVLTKMNHDTKLELSVVSNNIGGFVISIDAATAGGPQ